MMWGQMSNGFYGDEISPFSFFLLRSPQRVGTVSKTLHSLQWWSVKGCKK